MFDFMSFLMKFVESNSVIIILALFLITLILFIMVLCLFSRTKKVKHKIDPNDIDGDILVQEIEGLDNKIESVYSYAKSVNDKADLISKEMKKSLRNIGIERFDAFSDGGGDHSFSVALLNDEKDGVLIKSIYAREVTRMYIMPIKSGEANKELPQEDQNAIKNAIK